MRKIREILRMRWHLGLSVREVSRGLGISVGVVQKIAARAKTAGLSWELAEGLDEHALEERLYGRPAAPGTNDLGPTPCTCIASFGRRGLHLEYLEEHPDGLRYTAFCDTYRRWHSTAGLVMRQVHEAGEKTFVDYSGKKPTYVDPQTGEVIEAEFFVAVLGASNYTYAEATATQKVADFVGSHVRASAETASRLKSRRCPENRHVHW